MFLIIYFMLDIFAELSCKLADGHLNWSFPIGRWIHNQPTYFLRNQKQGYNLIFHGYMYKKEASFRNTINWICSMGNGKRVCENKCSARAIVNVDGHIKLGKKAHNHPPKFPNGELPSNVMKATMCNLYSSI